MILLWADLHNPDGLFLNVLNLHPICQVCHVVVMRVWMSLGCHSSVYHWAFHGLSTLNLGPQDPSAAAFWPTVVSRTLHNLRGSGWPLGYLHASAEIHVQSEAPYLPLTLWGPRKLLWFVLKTATKGGRRLIMLVFKGLALVSTRAAPVWVGIFSWHIY